MYEICRRIKTDGNRCDSPAIKNAFFCYHHARVRKLTRNRRRNPNDFTYLIPFAFPEDRASIQLNHFLVMQAFNEGRIDQRAAATYTGMLRACRLTLGKTPLIEPDKDHAVQRVILTPDGDELAQPREMLEPGERALVHHKDCPCRRCAEKYRGAEPEHHHLDCRCGLCAASDRPSAVSNPAKPAAASPAPTPQLNVETATAPDFNKTDFNKTDFNKTESPAARPHLPAGGPSVAEPGPPARDPGALGWEGEASAPACRQSKSLLATASS